MAFDPSRFTKPENPRGSQLVVVNIPTKIVDGEHLDRQGWWHKVMNDKDVWVTKTCSRIMLVTNKDHWENEIGAQYPEFTRRTFDGEEAKKLVEIGHADPFAADKPAFIKYDGWNAYRYPLESCCGLHSHELGEEHVLHQVLEQGYKEHKKLKNGEKPTWFEHVVDDLKHDSRQVRGVIGVHIVPTEEETARVMALLSQQKPVLIVTDNWEQAQGMVYALGRESVALKPSGIDLAHIAPQGNAVEKLQERADNMHELYKALPPVKASTLDDILDMGCDWLRDYEAIFVVSGLDKHPAQEAELLQSWRACGDVRPKLVVVRLSPEQGTDTPSQQDFQSDPKTIVFLPDKIGEALKERQREHALLMKEGMAACELCTRVRADSGGQHHPRGKDLRLGYEGYTNESRRIATERTILSEMITQRRAKSNNETKIG